MTKITKETLDNYAANPPKPPKNWIKVGMSSCGLAAGAQEVFNILTEEATKRRLDVVIKKCGCLGMCYAEPLVEVSVEGMPCVVYGKVDGATAVKIIDEHVVGGMLVNDHVMVKG